MSQVRSPVIPVAPSRDAPISESRVGAPGPQDGYVSGPLARSDRQATHIYLAVLVLYALNLSVSRFTLKMEVRLMCEECKRLEERFIAVRARISEIGWGLRLDSQLEQLEQANLSVLGEIMDHQIHCL